MLAVGPTSAVKRQGETAPSTHGNRDRLQGVLVITAQGLAERHLLACVVCRWVKGAEHRKGHGGGEVVAQGLLDAPSRDLPFPSVPLHLRRSHNQQDGPSGGSTLGRRVVVLKAHKGTCTQKTQTLLAKAWPLSAK